MTGRAIFLMIMLFFLLLISNRTLGADQNIVMLSPDDDRIDIGLNLEILEDPSGNLSIEAISSEQHAGAFQPSTEAIPNIGISPSAHWARFRIKSVSADPSTRLLVVHFPPLETIDLYWQDQTGAWVNKKSGRLHRYNEKDLPYPDHAFILPTLDDREMTFYTRFKSGYAIQMPLSIWRLDAFTAMAFDARLKTGIYFGFLLIMCAYNLFLYVSVRDKSYFYYVFYITCFGVMMAGSQGIDVQYLWPESRWMAQHTISIFTPLAMFGMILFARSFLNTAETVPKLDPILKAIQVIPPFLLIIGVIGFPYTGTLFGIIATSSAAFILISGLIAWYNGYRAARFFILAWCAFLLGVGLFALQRIGLLPNIPLTDSGIIWGSVIEVILLSLSLADRINFLQVEKEEAQNQALILQKQTADRLENEVELRTVELKDTLYNLERVNEDLIGINEELDQARVAAEEANRTQTEFLANMSHEIRTPMNAVIGMTNLALETDLNQIQKEYLATIDQSSNHLLNILNDILDLSKINADKIEFEKTDFSLSQMIDGLLQIMALQAEDKGLELLCTMPPELPKSVSGDPVRIRQVLLNLMSNAIKFTGSGYVELSVSCTEMGDGEAELAFAVKDTGIGIPPDKQEEIFAPFTQADVSTTRKYGGTGLGLHISMRLMTMMGGDMAVESKEGEGSTFLITLPLSATDFDGVSAYDDAAILKGKRVLLVDSHDVRRKHLEHMMTMRDLEVIEAENGLEAEHLIKDEPSFDLAFLDLDLEGIDGLSLTGIIKAATNIPVLLQIPTSANKKILSQCLESGAESSIRKPVTPMRLTRAFRQALGEDISVYEDEVLLDETIDTDGIPSLHILIVEDNRVNQLVAERMLIQQGHQVETAENGLEAIQRLEKGWVDLVLMDIQMPEMDGLTATRKIRDMEKESGHHLPIIGLTAHAMPGDEARFLAEGMDAYLSKPLRKNQLTKLLYNLTANRPMPQQESPDDDDEIILKMDELLYRIDHDMDLLTELISVFRAQTSEYVESIRKAIDVEDYDEIIRSSHTLKGMAANMSAIAIAKSAYRLELAARENQSDEIPDAYKELQNHIDKTLELIEDHMVK